MESWQEGGRNAVGGRRRGRWKRQGGRSNRSVDECGGDGSEADTVVESEVEEETESGAESEVEADMEEAKVEAEAAVEVEGEA